MEYLNQTQQELIDALRKVNEENKALKKIETDLNQRVKELNCHNEVSVLISRLDLTVDEIIQQIVELIPPSCQFPELAEAVITVNGKTFQTKSFQSTSYSVVQDVNVSGRKMGEIVVCYRDKQALNETVFLPEEVNLFFSIAVRIANFIDRAIKTVQLEKTEDNFKVLIESINDIVYEYDSNGILKYISPVVEKSFGFTVGEVIGQNFIKFVGGDDAFVAKKISDLQKYKVVNAEYKTFSKSGDVRWINLSTKAVYDGVVFMGGAGILTDITDKKLVELELQQSESLYRSILSSSPDNITLTDLKGDIILWSISAATMFGYKSNYDFKGHSILEFIHESDHERTLSAINNRFSVGAKTDDNEFKAVKSDGSVFDIEVNWDVVKNVEGKPVNLVLIVRDISNRKLLENKLQQSEKKYRNIFETVQDAYYESTIDGIILDISPAIERISKGQFMRDELIGKSLVQFYAQPEEREAFYSELVINNSVNDYELALRNKDGSVLPIAVTSALVFDLVGNPLKITGSMRDISERKQAEEAMRMSEERFRQVVEQTADLIAIADINGFITYASPTSVSMFQLSPEEMVGLNFLSFAADAEIANAEKQFRKILESDGVIKDSVFLMKRKDGALFRGELNGSRFQTSSYEGVLVTIRDISERNNTEANLRKLSRAIEQSPVSIVITDTNGSIEYANPKAIETTGYSLEELIGQNPRVLKSGDTTKEEYVELWKTISAGKDWHGTFHNKRKSGEKYWESSSISPVFDESGKISNYVAIKEDITVKKLVEQALKDSEANLRFAQKIAKMGSWEFNTKTHEVQWSENEYNLFGLDLTADVSVRDYFTSHIHPDDKYLLQEVFQNILTINNDTSNEFRFIMPDGSVKWIQGDVSPIMNGDEIIQLIGTHIDITDKKLSEQALIQSEASLNYAQELSDMGSWELNFITNEFNWSDNYYRLLGLEPQKEGVSNDYFYENLYLDDRILLDQMLQEVIKTRKSSFRDVRFVMPDGSLKWIHDIVIPTFKGEQIIGINGVIFDITGKKKVQDQLKRSEVSLNYSQQIANMGSWEFNLITNEYTWSENNYLLVGMIPFEKEITIETFYQLLHPDDIFYMKESIQYIFESKLPVSINIRVMLPEGQIRWFQNNIVPVFEDNELIALRGVNIDITERKQKDDQINKLSLVATHSPVSIVITDLKGNVEFVNPAFEELTGYSFEMIKGKNIRVLKSGRNYKNIYENLWTTINNGNIWQAEWENKRLNGEFYWESISITPIFNESGDVVNFMALKQDVTKRKQSEQEIRDLNLNLEKKIQERTSELANTNIDLLNEIAERKKTEQKFSTAFQSSSALMAISDFYNGEYLDVNNTFVEAIGYSREELIGKTNKELKLFKDSNLRLKILENLDSGKQVNKLEVVICSKKGVERVILLSADTIFVGEKRSLLTVAVDITDRKNAENEMHKARFEAEKANVAKSEFLSRMSHELRTPMNSILGFAQILEMGELNSGQRKGVNHILRSGKHLLGLINEVLDISRIEAGQLSISMEPIKLNVLLEDMLDVVQPLAVENQIQLELTDDSDNNLFVKSDRQSLRQIMLNLLNNAIKYNKQAGSVIIKTELITTDSTKPNFVRISVTDTGIGISAENIPKLFTPFERIGASKTGVEGTGLGLAVVKKLIEAMDGSFGVESTLDEGSTFWVQLPKAENQLEILHSDSFLQASQLSSGKTGLILYIEDNASNIELIEQILAYQRPLVRIVSNMNGTQAVGLAIEHKPDLILLDLNLPDINGDEVLKLLKANDLTRDIPVVIISADAMNKQVGNLLSLGAKTYLTKPLEVTGFLEIVDEFI